MHELGILNFKNMEESGELRFLRGYLPRLKSPVVFDVGAHTGSYSQAVLEIHPEAQVFAFEPHPKTYAVLSAEPGGISQHFALALGREAGRSQIFDYENDQGSEHASLYKGVIEHIHHEEAASWEIDVDTVDAVSARLEVERIHLLKIDTEGHELAVLQGASRMLQERRIRAIQFEFNETNVISRTFFKDFWDLLPNYNFFRLTPAGAIQFKEYNPLLCEVFAFQNIVCVEK
jgi:FkbM family methyltransferase